MNFEVELETLRAIVTAFILLYLWRMGRHERQHKGWRLVLAGFSLILFGSLLDITDNFPGLNQYVVIGKTHTEAFLEKVVGYLGGFIVLFFGFTRWFPYITRLRSTEAELQQKTVELESTVLSRTENLLQKTAELELELHLRKQAQADLRIAAIAFESQEGMIISDANQVILRVNKAFTRITGYGAEDAVGRNTAILKSGRQDAMFYQAMWQSLNRDKYWQGEIWNRRKNGEVFPEWLSITAVTDDVGQVTHYVAAFSDITLQKQAEEIIHNLAFYDPLTNLPNRRMLQDRLQHVFSSSERHQRHGAVLFIDLDNFKELNDTKGHNIGDLLLIEVAARLQTCVRTDDTVARLGGDEFVIVLNDLHAEAEQAAFQADAIAEKIRAAINQPCALQGHEYHGAPSIGICLFRGNDITLDELLKRADTAMYEAKRSGRNAIRFFDPATHAAMEARIALEVDLRRAVPEKQLRLYYQMQVDRRGRILGAEVLLRWQHPERGLVPPMEFIPLAEETGLILPIGHWVLETACAKLKAWESDPVTRHLQIAVNVSARQFRHPHFVEQVCAVLEQTAIDPGKLKLELTESLVLDNIGDTITKMQALKDIGVGFSMDDFGTGYSSLAYLSQLPLEQVKIDQSFVRNITVKPGDAVIVQTIIGMANNLGLNVIAEGVETQEQRDFLERNGCPAFQGYLFGKPVPVEAFEISLQEAPAHSRRSAGVSATRDAAKLRQQRAC